MATPTAFSTIPATLRQGACTVLYVAALIGGTAHANAPVPEGPLVSTEWLAANLNRADVRIVEVSVNPGLYERSHVPGAVNFSWHNDLNDKVRRDIVGKEQFEKLLSQAGVKDGTTVVLYGDTNNWFAAWGPGSSTSMACRTSSCWTAAARSGRPKTAPSTTALRNMRPPPTAWARSTPRCARA